MRGLLLLSLWMLAAPAAAQTVERVYGPDPRQRLDFTAAANAGAPLVLFVHGGAWSFGDKRAAAHMAAHFHGRGFAFASINYRLVPNATVGQQADDVASALAGVLRDAGTLGIDARRVVLIGHSAGAHLAALVGTDPRYLAARRLEMSAVDGIVLLDGAGYDVPRQIAAAGPLLRRMYLDAFGPREAAQRHLSPTLHAEVPNVASFAIIHSSRRPDSTAQSEALAAALGGGNSSVNVFAVDDSHARIFRNFGQPDHEATVATDAFIDVIFAAAEAFFE